MKFQPDRVDTFAITAIGPGWLKLNADVRHDSLLLAAEGPQDWPVKRFEDLTAEHFAQVAAAAQAAGANIVLFGSGAKLRFVPPGWLAPLMAARIGVDTMDTAAACRTWNVLASEGREVLAALLVEPA